MGKKFFAVVTKQRVEEKKYSSETLFFFFGNEKNNQLGLLVQQGREREGEGKKRERRFFSSSFLVNWRTPSASGGDVMNDCSAACQYFRYYFSLLSLPLQTTKIKRNKEKMGRICSFFLFSLFLITKRRKTTRENNWNQNDLLVCEHYWWLCWFVVVNSKNCRNTSIKARGNISKFCITK